MMRRRQTHEFYGIEEKVERDRVQMHWTSRQNKMRFGLMLRFLWNGGHRNEFLSRLMGSTQLFSKAFDRKKSYGL
jgi:hypothetical protein